MTNDLRDDKPVIDSAASAKLAWSRPAVERMHAGSAEEGADNRMDFESSES